MIDDPQRLSEEHLANVAANLQLIADLAYGDVSLAIPEEGGRLRVVADARPNTAVAPTAATRVGMFLDAADEREAHEAVVLAEPVRGTRERVSRGIRYNTSAYPVGVPAPAGVLIRNLAEQVSEAPGAMEIAFMDAAEELIGRLAQAPLKDVRTEEPFATTRSAGDGVLRVGADGCITYASPNAVTIMRLAGYERALKGTNAPELPGGGYGIAPVLGAYGGLSVEVQVAGRSLAYRAIGFGEGALVLVEDVTERRRREAELKVKEATIREVHHRVKNNLQTVASLLRIQARRSGSDEVRHALAEATERVSSMAVVHDLLAVSDEESVDFAEVARTVVNLVRRGLVGDSSAVKVTVDGETGRVDARVATSLTLAVAELVHNALEHGVAGRDDGEVNVHMRRLDEELVLVVRDNGVGLPDDFVPGDAANLGLAIVSTVVHNDLKGSLVFSGTRGTTVTVKVPLENNGAGTASMHV